MVFKISYFLLFLIINILFRIFILRESHSFFFSEVERPRFKLIKTRSKTLDPCGLFSMCLDAGGRPKCSALSSGKNLASTTHVRVCNFHLLTS